MKYDIVLFDLDGTLFEYIGRLGGQRELRDDADGISGASVGEYSAVCWKWYPHPHGQGNPTGEENPRFEEAFAMFKAYYLTHNQIKTRPYDGVMELLHDYEEQDMPMAIVTNKNQESVDVLVRDVFKNHVRVAVGDDGIRPRKTGSSPGGRSTAQTASGLRRPVMGAHGRRGCLIRGRLAEWIKPHVLYVGDSDVDAATAENPVWIVPCVHGGFRENLCLRPCHMWSCYIQNH